MSKRPPRNNQPEERLVTSDEFTLWRFVTRNDKKLHDEDLWDEMEEMDASPAVPVKPVTTSISTSDWQTATIKTGHFLYPLESGIVIGVDRRTASRLNKGALPIDRVVDMHGLNQEQAQIRLKEAVLKAYANLDRVLLIITGKGTRGEGILKKRLPDWLNDDTIRPFILAFTRATPKDGGDGAFYILLKRQRTRD